MHSTSLRRRLADRRTLGALGAGLGAVALAASLTVTTTHHADASIVAAANGNIGGCQTYDVSGAQGWNIGVCISGSGQSASPDIYVNSIGSTGSSCTIDIETWDGSNDKLGDTPVPCPSSAPTRLKADQVTVTAATTVHAFARLRLDGVAYSSGDSKPLDLPAASSSNNAATPSPSPNSADTPAAAAQGAGNQAGANTYNAAAAAAWATTNISGGYFSSGDWYSDDCTDFVSAAMWAGGGLSMSFGSNDHRDDHNWFMVTDGSVRSGSWSWTAAVHLKNYLTLSGRGTEVSLQNAKPGDVIFVNWGPGGNDTPDNNPSGQAGIDHVGMIVGNPGAAGGYNVKIAQHTRDVIETLADWRAHNPNLQVWVYSISS